MTLKEFIAEIADKMGKPKSVSRRIIEDYPDLKGVCCHEITRVAGRMGRI